MEASVASGAPVLSSEDALDVERSLAQRVSISDLTLAEFDIAATAEHICRGFRRVALQFPDELLPHAEAVFEALQSAVAEHWSSAEPAPELFVLADTSFDGFQVDFVAAQHLGADMLVHYGPADLQAHGPMEVRFVFCRRPIDASALAAAYAASFEPTRRVLVVFSLAYAHASSALRRALASSHPAAIVSTAEVERRAEMAAPSRGAAGTFERPAAGGGGGGDGSGGGVGQQTNATLLRRYRDAIVTPLTLFRRYCDAIVTLVKHC